MQHFQNTLLHIRPASRGLLTQRRFPPPWTLEDKPACFIVRDHNRQALAYVY
jgi:hypothetical protein